MPKYTRLLEPLCLFVLGGGGYCALEVAWRGFSHWTMFVVGGAALCWLAWLDARRPLPQAAALGALGATSLELAAGLWCTRVLHVTVWDYRTEWADLAGLICPKYSLLWLLLCAWVLLGMHTARRLACLRLRRLLRR